MCNELINYLTKKFVCTKNNDGSITIITKDCNYILIPQQQNTFLNQMTSNINNDLYPYNLNKPLDISKSNPKGMFISPEDIFNKKSNTKDNISNPFIKYDPIDPSNIDKHWKEDSDDYTPPNIKKYY
ncbi:hypothetical protein EBI_22502 [Enterocytozoon bieneusi H348]|nr:hypothetical protein EBI_22502 [Enterocytozoon bieneusi H348]|eukprot:XP_002650154.1 hypothetical protein EBI_22502 [Enterocytozoon bieneusi H348]